MKKGVLFTYPEAQTSLPSCLSLVHVEIDGKTYIGQGTTRPLARHNAAENALKKIILEQMTAAAIKARKNTENDNVGNTTAEEATVNNPSNPNKETEEPDEIPWSSLASFALCKLLQERKNQDTIDLIPRPEVSYEKIKERQPENEPVIQKKLPQNATTIHPVLLLNQMRPGPTYHEISRVGEPPNTIFTLGVHVEGQEFTGAAENKWNAQTMAAKAALHGLYNFVYPEE